MINELRDYYISKGICAVDFSCNHYDECSSTADSNKFSKAKEPYIGTEYERGIVPRLLFLSLDSGSSELDDRKRTIESVRKQTLAWTPEKGDKVKHWYRTHQFVRTVFDELKKSFNLDIEIGEVDSNNDFKENEIDKIKPYFAHTNSAKCCLNIKGKKQANDVLFKNCREYIPEEIDILSPIILVSQGNMAKAAVELYVKDKKIVSEETVAYKNDFKIIKLDNNKKVIWIHHYHPACYGYFKKNRDNYGKYAKKVANFIKKNKNKRNNL